MAGIAGVIGGRADDTPELVAALGKALVHSGRTVLEPWSDGAAGLCRARSGVDNPDPQPVFSADRSKCLVLFGECFGYEQRKAELAATGYRFERQDDDAEFCLALVEQEGERGLAALSGSFCFAHYDSRKRELMLVSDRLGTRPVTKIICSIPASRASSTAYWISGRSTTGSISLGIALVAGRKRVPRPATGKTALRIGFMGAGLAAIVGQEKGGAAVPIRLIAA